VIPIDTVIFTGKISRKRMIHEHPLEYERIFGRYSRRTNCMERSTTKQSSQQLLLSLDRIVVFFYGYYTVLVDACKERSL